MLLTAVLLLVLLTTLVPYLTRPQIILAQRVVPPVPSVRGLQRREEG